jgi:hypothetical protein
MSRVERAGLGQLKTWRVPAAGGACFCCERVVHACVPLAEKSTVRKRVWTIKCERRWRQK